MRQNSDHSVTLAVVESVQNLKPSPSSPIDRRLTPQKLAQAESLRKEIETLTSDEEVVRDTLEGEVDLDGLIDFLLADIGHNEAMIAAIKAQSETILNRAARLERRTEMARGFARKALEIAGWTSRERPLGTVSLAPKAPALGELDESKIPTDFWKEQAPKLDRGAVLDALKAHLAAIRAAVERGDTAEANRLKQQDPVPGAKLAPPAQVFKIRKG